MFALVGLPPSSMGRVWSGPGRCCTRSEFTVQLNDFQPRKPPSCIEQLQANRPVYAQEGDIVFISFIGKQICPLERNTAHYPSKMSGIQRFLKI